VFDEVRPDMRIAQEEIFGPVLSVMTFEDADDACQIANSTAMDCQRPCGLKAFSAST